MPDVKDYPLGVGIRGKNWFKGFLACIRANPDFPSGVPGLNEKCPNHC